MSKEQKRRSAIFVGSKLLCPPCGVTLNPQFDKEAEDGPDFGWCWDCPVCGEWFTVGGEPAIWGTSVPERD